KIADEMENPAIRLRNVRIAALAHIVHIIGNRGAAHMAVIAVHLVPDTVLGEQSGGFRAARAIEPVIETHGVLRALPFDASPLLVRHRRCPSDIIPNLFYTAFRSVSLATVRTTSA